MTDTADTSVLRARGLRKDYGKGEGLVRAVTDRSGPVPGSIAAVPAVRRTVSTSRWPVRDPKPPPGSRSAP